MKVALFVHCFFPDHFYGTETYTLQVAQALQRLGHEVTVVAGIFQGEPQQPAMVTRYDHAGVPVVALDKNHAPHSRVAETYWQEAMRPHLRQVLAELKPDLVHVTHLINHTAVLLEEVATAGIPLVGTLTDFFGFCYNNKLEASDGSLCAGPNMLRSNCVACHLKAVNDGAGTGARPRLGYGLAGLRLRLGYAAGALRGSPDAGSVVPDIADRPGRLLRAYGAYDAMIAPTQFLQGAYVRNGFDRSRLHLSRFGVDLDRAPKPERDAGGPLTIGYVGQLAPHKGVDLLLSAAAAVAGRIRLQIYGPADQDPNYMARLRALAPPGTEFLGTFPSSRMAEVLAPMDLLAIPSTWYENSPLVLLNALATHTPVLVSDVQGLTEFITEGKDGWSFKRGDVTDLTRVLSGLATDPARVRRASADTEYSRTIQSMGDDVAAIHQSVLARRAHAA